MKKRTVALVMTPEMRVAADELKRRVPLMASDVPFKIRGAIGELVWEPLDHVSRHKLGKHVRANLAEFGLIHVGKAGTIALYKKSTI